MMKKVFSLKTLFIVMILISIPSCKVSMPYTLEMKTELKKMYKEDQDIQKELMSNTSKSKIDSIEKQKQKIFNYNYKKAVYYFDKYGYPGIKQNDEFTSFAFWLIVQHCDNDVDFQYKVLKQMKKNLKNKNVSLKNYAYLYDRVMKNKGKKQLYGTQMVWDSTGVHKPYQIKKEMQVDARRRQVGLETLIEYLNKFNKVVK